jgi:IPT/TIG domain
VRVLSLLVLVSLLTNACGSTGSMAMVPRYMGIRPDAPSPTTATDVTQECHRRHPGNASEEVAAVRTACERYATHVVWAEQLAEAYRSRATFNEWSIYVAGTIALVGLGLVGGLGIAAAASAETLGLIGVSTGFSAMFFAFMDNKRRAAFYTEGANKIAKALAEATTTVTPSAAESPDALTARYGTATKILAGKVSEATIEVEDGRYAAAEAAAASTAAQQANKQLQEMTALLATAAVTGIDPTKGASKTSVTITTAGIDLNKEKVRVRVFVAGEPVRHDVVNTTQLKISMPDRPKETQTVIRVYVDSWVLAGERAFTYE